LCLKKTVSLITEIENRQSHRNNKNRKNPRGKSSKENFSCPLFQIQLAAKSRKITKKRLIIKV